MCVVLATHNRADYLRMGVVLVTHNRADYFHGSTTGMNELR